MGLHIDEINSRDEQGFIELLSGIFEHSPWVPELVYGKRPFTDREALHREMTNAMRHAPELQRMAEVEHLTEEAKPPVPGRMDIFHHATEGEKEFANLPGT